RSRQHLGDLRWRDRRLHRRRNPLAQAARGHHRLIYSAVSRPAGPLASHGNGPRWPPLGVSRPGVQTRCLWCQWPGFVLPPSPRLARLRVIRFKKVSKVYARGARPALDQVSLEVERGEFVFLVGASGSGKSTFLRLVLREERPTSGSVFVAGRDLAHVSTWKVPRLRRQIGCVFQDFRLLHNKTVFDNVAIAMQVIGKPRHQVMTVVPETLEMVGLAGKEKR